MRRCWSLAPNNSATCPARDASPRRLPSPPAPTPQAHGSLHFGGAWPDNSQLSGSVTLEAGSLADDYHVFALEWEADQARLLLVCLQGAVVPGGSARSALKDRLR